MVLNIKELVYDKGYKLGKASELVKGDARESEADPKTSEILKLQKEITRDRKKFTQMEERRHLLLRDIRDEIEDILQMLG